MLERQRLPGRGEAGVSRQRRRTVPRGHLDRGSIQTGALVEGVGGGGGTITEKSGLPRLHPTYLLKQGNSVRTLPWSKGRGRQDVRTEEGKLEAPETEKPLLQARGSDPQQHWGWSLMLREADWRGYPITPTFTAG